MKKAAVYAVIFALILSCVAIGIKNSKVEDSVVTISNTNAQSPISAIDNTVPNAESDFGYSTVPGEYVTINDYTGITSSVVIPDTIDGLPVKIIAETAFSENSDITYIYIPASVTEIAQNAFEKCDSLIRIVVSEDNASYSSLDGVLYSKDQTSLIAFPCGVSGEFTIPEDVTDIESCAFYFCYQLTQINMYNNVINIGDNAFAYCWNLITVRLSDNLKSLGDDAFFDCLCLTKLYLPANLTSIGTDALLGAQDSTGHLEYYLVDGVYCVEGSYAEEYVYSLGLTPISTADTRYDPDTDISVSSVFENGIRIDVCEYLEGSIYDEAAELIDSNGFYGFKVYNIAAHIEDASRELTKDAAITVPISSFTLPTKIFRLENGSLVPLEYQVITSNGKKYISFSNSSLGTFVVAEYFTVKKGDVNGDGEIHIDDARLALRAAVGLEILYEVQEEAADVDNSGIVGIDDARTILRIAVGLEVLT